MLSGGHQRWPRPMVAMRREQARRMREQRNEEMLQTKLHTLHKCLMGEETSFAAQDEHGVVFHPKFKFKNSMGLEKIHLHPNILAELNYSVVDLHNITTGIQPEWNLPTFLGDVETTTRGVDTLGEGEMSDTDMAFPQKFGERENHRFASIVFVATKLTMKGSYIDFLTEPVPKEQVEMQWFKRHIHFQKVVLEHGSLRQRYPLVQYTTEMTGATVTTTGQGVHIPFKMLMDTGRGGKYSIDNFVMGAIQEIGEGFKDFYFRIFLERLFNLPSPVMESIKRTKKLFLTVDDAYKFAHETFAILNKREGNVHPIDDLIQAVREDVWNYNPMFGKGHLVGLALNNRIIGAEKKHRYNAENSYIDFAKKGGLRNVDHLGDLDEYKYQASPDTTVIISGVTKFHSKMNPSGIMPLQRTIRTRTHVVFPSCFDIYNKSRPMDHNYACYTVNALDTSNKVSAESYKPIDYIKLINHYAQDGKNLSLFNDVFAAGRQLEFGKMVEKSCHGAPHRKEYFAMLYDVVTAALWAKHSNLESGNISLRAVVSDMRFHITGHGFGLTTSPGRRHPFLMPKMPLINSYVNDIKGLLASFSSGGNPVPEWLILLLVLSEEGEIQWVEHDEEGKTLGVASTQVAKEFYTQLIADSGAEPALTMLANIRDPVIMTFYPTTIRGLILTIIKSSLFVTFGELWEKMTEYTVPPFWRTVLFRHEDMVADAAIFGTENMAQRLHIMPTAMSDFNTQTLEAHIEFKDSPGIRFVRERDARVVPDVFITLPSKVPMTCHIPVRGSQLHLEIVLFPLKDALDETNRLWMHGFDEQQALLAQREMDRLRANQFETLQQYLLLRPNVSLTRHAAAQTCDYYLKDGKIFHYFVSYKGGYRSYNINTKNYDIMHGLTGPEQKLYNM